MIIVPGFVIALATFPGVIVHEAAHVLFCKLARVAIFDVCYFRLGNPSGYVIHEEPSNFRSAFLIAMGPFFINSIVCILLCFPAFVPVRIFDRHDPASYFLLWLGLSIGMHAIPSTQDARSLWAQATKAAAKLNPLAIISFPLVILVYIANAGRFFWLDLMYGFAIGLLLPEFVFNHVL